jgi:hypothetical protein
MRIRDLGVFLTLDPGLKKFESGINVPDSQHCYRDATCIASCFTTMSIVSCISLFPIGRAAACVDSFHHLIRKFSASRMDPPLQTLKPRTSAAAMSSQSRKLTATGRQRPVFHQRRALWQSSCRYKSQLLRRMIAKMNWGRWTCEKSVKFQRNWKRRVLTMGCSFISHRTRQGVESSAPVQSNAPPLLSMIGGLSALPTAMMILGKNFEQE